MEPDYKLGWYGWIFAIVMLAVGLTPLVMEIKEWVI